MLKLLKNIHTWLICKMLNKNKSSHRRCSIKQGVCNNFAIFTGKRPCWSEAVGLIKAGLQHVFSCEYCQIFKGTYFKEHLWTVVSVKTRLPNFLWIFLKRSKKSVCTCFVSLWIRWNLTLAQTFSLELHAIFRISIL